MIMRGGAVEARRAHNPKVVRSNRTPATLRRYRSSEPSALKIGRRRH